MHPESDEGHREIEQALNFLGRTYLSSGYRERLTSLVPREDIVLSHNDLTELNVLVEPNKNCPKLTIIDYEFTDWNPKWYDLANYLNEFCCDNASASSTCCIKYYM